MLNKNVNSLNTFLTYCILCRKGKDFVNFLFLTVWIINFCTFYYYFLCKCWKCYMILALLICLDWISINPCINIQCIKWIAQYKSLIELKNKCCLVEKSEIKGSGRSRKKRAEGKRSASACGKVACLCGHWRIAPIICCTGIYTVTVHCILRIAICARAASSNLTLLHTLCVCFKFTIHKS